MILKNKNGVPFLQFPKLAEQKGVRHAVFTRNGGHSSGPYKSLNISFGLGDAPGSVRRNRKLLSKCLDGGGPVYVDQTHGTNILLLKNKEADMKKLKTAGQSHAGDAMITDDPAKVLVIQVADCQSVLLYDPSQHVVANVHAGWRGSIRDVIGKTVRAMKDNFGSSSKDILAGVGPSLGPCCAEFVNYKTEIPEKFWSYKDGSDHFDFWSMSRDQLCDAGLSKNNIEFSHMCTRCETDRFFSYRGEGVTGRFGVAIGLRK